MQIRRGHLRLGAYDDVAPERTQGLSDFMRKLPAGYAVSCNLRHKRRGYLFQNRYKSIICEKEKGMMVREPAWESDGHISPGQWTSRDEKK